jgi:tRNA 2-selenouridine synthase SelU
MHQDCLVPLSRGEILACQAKPLRQDSIKGFDNFAQYWLRSLEKIQKRLGLERYNALLKLVNNALSKY